MPNVVRPAKAVVKKGTEVASELLKEATGAYEDFAVVLKRNWDRFSPEVQESIAGGKYTHPQIKKINEHVEDVLTPKIDYGTLRAGHGPTTAQGKKVVPGDTVGSLAKKLTPAAAVGTGLGATLAANDAKASPLDDDSESASIPSNYRILDESTKYVPKQKDSKPEVTLGPSATKKETPISPTEIKVKPEGTWGPLEDKVVPPIAPKPALLKQVLAGTASDKTLGKIIKDPVKDLIGKGSTSPGTFEKLEDKPSSTYQDLMRQRQDLISIYQDSQDTTAWLKVAEQLAHALTKYAAARDGFNKGIDMSGIKMTPTDWSQFDKQANDRLKVNLQTVDLGLQNLKEEQAGLARSGERKEDRESREKIAREANWSREKAAGKRVGSTGPTYEQKRADRIADESTKHERNLSERDAITKEKVRTKKLEGIELAKGVIDDSDKSDDKKKKAISKLVEQGKISPTLGKSLNDNLNQYWNDDDKFISDIDAERMKYQESESSPQPQVPSPSKPSKDKKKVSVHALEDYSGGK